MSRTWLHILIAFVWAIFATWAAQHYLESASSTADVDVWSGRVLGVFALGILGLFLLLWSWLKTDAVSHGKPATLALSYSLVSIPSCGLAMLAYFFATRERRAAWLASLQFLLLCLALLAAVITTLG